MEGVRTARGRGLNHSHRRGRFATGFQSLFAPVSNDGAGAQGGVWVWVVRAVWERLGLSREVRGRAPRP
jgi:hypothetical protein